MLSQTARNRQIDIFNGDADGLIALHQLRMAAPREAELVTGVKRDIGLLERVEASAGDSLCVLDVSLDSNLQALQRLLAAGAEIQYFDHHQAEQRFLHQGLHFHLSDQADCCTSMLVNRYLGERYPMWAIAAAYGDGMHQAAHGLAMQHGIAHASRAELEELGRLLNYNAYGEQIDDLQFHPADLYLELHRYANPFDFIHNSTFFLALQFAYQQECDFIEQLQPLTVSQHSEVYLLPAQSWSYRLSGILANRLHQTASDKSFAVLTPKRAGDYQVSVRSARPQMLPASRLCSRFTSGGGRQAAAGINHLPAQALDHFIKQFFDYFDALSG